MASELCNSSARKHQQVNLKITIWRKGLDLLLTHANCLYVQGNDTHCKSQNAGVCTLNHRRSPRLQHNTICWLSSISLTYKLLIIPFWHIKVSLCKVHHSHLKLSLSLCNLAKVKNWIRSQKINSRVRITYATFSWVDIPRKSIYFLRKN